MSLQTYRLYTYDVWGNDNDGYEVNDVYRQSDTVEIDFRDWTDEQILAALKDAGIWDGVHTLGICMHSDSECIYIEDPKNGKPIAELRVTTVL